MNIRSHMNTLNDSDVCLISYVYRILWKVYSKYNETVNNVHSGKWVTSTSKLPYIPVLNDDINIIACVHADMPCKRIKRNINQAIKMGRMPRHAKWQEQQQEQWIIVLYYGNGQTGSARSIPQQPCILSPYQSRQINTGGELGSIFELGIGLFGGGSRKVIYSLLWNSRIL